jgi:hypothetical protein
VTLESIGDGDEKAHMDRHRQRHVGVLTLGIAQHCDACVTTDVALEGSRRLGGKFLNVNMSSGGNLSAVRRSALPLGARVVHSTRT